DLRGGTATGWWRSACRRSGPPRTSSPASLPRSYRRSTGASSSHAKRRWKEPFMDDRTIGRRALLKSLGVLATGLGSTEGARATPASAASPPPPRSRPSGGPYNILLILTDQERYLRPGELPAGFKLPAHERLVSRGTVFENHRINSCVCTPSRSVLYTGRHI